MPSPAAPTGDRRRVPAAAACVLAAAGVAGFTFAGLAGRSVFAPVGLAASALAALGTVRRAGRPAADRGPGRAPALRSWGLEIVWDDVVPVGFSRARRDGGLVDLVARSGVARDVSSDGTVLAQWTLSVEELLATVPFLADSDRVDVAQVRAAVCADGPVRVTYRAVRSGSLRHAQVESPGRTVTARWTVTAP